MFHPDHIRGAVREGLADRMRMFVAFVALVGLGAILDEGARAFLGPMRVDIGCIGCPEGGR